MTLNLTTVVVDYLKSHPHQRFTARDIARWIFNHYPEEIRQKQERSKAIIIPLNSDEAMISQIVAEIGASKNTLLKKSNQNIKITEERPRKYYWSSQTDESEIKEVEDINSLTPQTFKETELYPKLSEFLWNELDLYSKRIDEKRATNKNGPQGNKWLYPDIVAIEDLSREWHHEIKNCVKQCADQKITMWSFEVKVLINRSNVRESFFQTISNSAWANFAYLVASQINDDGSMRELRLLSSLHGIGVIRLNAHCPTDSEILIPAKERTPIDWSNANRLAEENKDFLEYIKRIRQFYQTGDIRPSDWDHLDITDSE